MLIEILDKEIDAILVPSEIQVLLDVWKIWQLHQCKVKVGFMIVFKAFLNSQNEIVDYLMVSLEYQLIVKNEKYYRFTLKQMHLEVPWVEHININ